MIDADPNTTILYETDKMREYKWLTTRSNAVSTYPPGPSLNSAAATTMATIYYPLERS